MRPTRAPVTCTLFNPSITHGTYSHPSQFLLSLNFLSLLPLLLHPCNSQLLLRFSCSEAGVQCPHSRLLMPALSFVILFVVALIGILVQLFSLFCNAFLLCTVFLPIECGHQLVL